ncbi:MAG: peptide chain release factor 1 [Sphaerochaetaceae bacterium]
MLEKLPEFTKQLQELDEKLSTPEVTSDMKLYKALMQDRAHLAPVVEKLEELNNLDKQIKDATELLHNESDSEMVDMAKEELAELKAKFDARQEEVKVLLIPPDPLEGKNIIMEIRAGTGGDEAALFAADLYDMYRRYCEAKGWKIEVMSSNEIALGGYKEIVLSISGKDVYGSLRWESGVHRVQRVPETENSGRIHTSAASVAVLPEAEETDIVIRDEDLRIDVMRAGGHGGQCVNTTDSAVRLTHIPTGLVVIQQDEKSQLKNKNKAMRVLRARLYDLEESKKNAERAATRKSMVGSGDRSERIRTYNFPQNRLTDHRIDLTLYKLDLILAGDLDQVIVPLKIAAGEAALKEA